MKVLIGGSHGFIGNALVERLNAAGHEVIRLVRKDSDQPGELQWDPASGQIDVAALEGINAVIHLGGVSISERRWTESTKQQLWNSRVISTETLANAIAQLQYKPSVFICASAVGYYGSRGDEELDETSTNGEGFLARLCAMWEDATTPASDAKVRVVNLRSGVVLDPQGGALAKQIPIFKSFAGGPIGLGSHWMSWISLHDEVEAILWVLNHSSISGPVNLCSPSPVINRNFTFALSRALSRPAIIPTPRFLLRLILGEGVTDEVLLASQRAYPSKLLQSGFTFQDTDVEATLHAMVRPLDEDAEETSAQTHAVLGLDDLSEPPTSRQPQGQTQQSPERNN